MRTMSSVPSKLRLAPLAGAVCTALCIGAIPSAMATPDAPAITARGEAKAVAATTRVRHTVVLKEAPVASYRGGVAGLAAAPPIQRGRKAGRVDLRSPQALAYVEYLQQRQAGFVAWEGQKDAPPRIAFLSRGFHPEPPRRPEGNLVIVCDVCDEIQQGITDGVIH